MNTEKEFEVLIEKVPNDWPEKNNIRKNWNTWNCPPSRFNWFYSDEEWAYIIEGKVKITTKSGNSYEFGTGDLVKFASGLECTWEVIEPVRKYYTFK